MHTNTSVQINARGERPITTLFPLGCTTATPRALALLRAHGTNPAALLDRHAAGDWGEIAPEDRGLNERAVRDGDRVLSIYHVGTGRVCVITEADRSATTLLLPEDY